MTTDTKAINRSVKALEVVKIPSSLNQAQADKIRKKALQIYELARAMNVVDNETKLSAEKLSKSCSDFIKSTKAEYKEELDKRVKAKQDAERDRKELVDLLDTFLSVVKDAMDDLDAKNRAYIAAENRRIEEENRKKMIEAQEAADKAKEKEIESLKEIGTAEAKQAIKELKEAPTVAAPVKLESQVKGSFGTVNAACWTSDIEGNDESAAIKKLVLAAAKDFDRYGKYLVPAWPVINSAARNDKEKFDVPGFKAWDKGKTSHR